MRYSISDRVSRIIITEKSILRRKLETASNAESKKPTLNCGYQVTDENRIQYVYIYKYDPENVRICQSVFYGRTADALSGDTI